MRTDRTDTIPLIYLEEKFVKLSLAMGRLIANGGRYDEGEMLYLGTLAVAIAAECDKWLEVNGSEVPLAGGRFR